MDSEIKRTTSSDITESEIQREQNRHKRLRAKMEYHLTLVRVLEEETLLFERIERWWHNRRVHILTKKIEESRSRLNQLLLCLLESRK